MAAAAEKASNKINNFPHPVFLLERRDEKHCAAVRMTRYRSAAFVNSRTNFNLYHYAGNNPVKYTDPDGREDCGIFNRTNGFDTQNFRLKTFNRSNTLNQLELDKALGISSNSANTKSCQTTALINAYAAQNKDGITGDQILNSLTNGGDLKPTVDPDGSPAQSLNSISTDLAESCRRTTYLKADDNKTKDMTTSVTGGVILGYAKNTKTNDSHYGYQDSKGTIDSMDPNRASASNYHENTYRHLHEENLKKINNGDGNE